MRIPVGWNVVCRPRFLPPPKSSDFASESHGPISVLPEPISILPAAVGRDAGPDLTTNCIHRSPGFCLMRNPTDFHSIPHLTVLCPIHRPTSFPTALPCI